MMKQSTEHRSGSPRKKPLLWLYPLRRWHFLLVAPHWLFMIVFSTILMSYLVTSVFLRPELTAIIASVPHTSTDSLNWNESRPLPWIVSDSSASDWRAAKEMRPSGHD